MAERGWGWDLKHGSIQAQSSVVVPRLSNNTLWVCYGNILGQVANIKHPFDQQMVLA